MGEQRFTTASVLEFDDGTCSAMALHTGDMESCEKVRDMLPAVSYSGDKRVLRAFIGIFDADGFAAALSPAES